MATSTLLTDRAAALQSLLDAQYGRLVRRQALALGYDDRDLARMRDQGLLTNPAPGLWVVSGAPTGFEAQTMAAVLVAGGDSVAARATAAKLLGLRDKPPAVIDVLVPARRTPTAVLPGTRIRRSRTITADQVVDVGGVPTTTAARTIVDHAMMLNTDALRDLVARGLRADLVDLAELAEQLRRSGRIKGARRMRAAVGSLDPDVAATESAAEEAAFRALVDAGLPPPQRQHEVVASGHGRIRLDLAYVDRRVAIEIDGYWWHSTPKQKAADERRQNALVLAGWTVLRFSADVAFRQPEHLVAAVRAALAA